MKHTYAALLALSLGIGLVAPPAEARQVRTETVHFEPGRHEATLRDHLVAHGVVTYDVRVHPGETLNVTLNSSNPSTYFHVYAPGDGPGTIPIGRSDRTGATVPAINRFETRSEMGGTYVVTVFLARPAARAKEQSTYILDVVVGDVQMPVMSTSGTTETVALRGPDFLEVEVESRLLIHAMPSTDAEVLLHATDGTVFRNLGCEADGERTWCHVERPSDGLRGWADSRYLRGETAALAGLVGIEETPYAHESGWNILVRPDTGNGCLAESNRDGVQIQIGFDPADDSTFLAVFTRDHPGIEQHEHMAVIFDLDGDEFIGDATGVNRAGYEGGYVHVTNPAFLMDLADKRTMTVYPVGMPSFEVDLTGSKRAIGKLIECQMAQR